MEPKRTIRNEFSKDPFILLHPADAQSHRSFKFFVDEQFFWRIHDPIRVFVYGFANGVLAEEIDPVIAQEIHESLSPDEHILDALISELEDVYFETYNQGDEKFPNRNAIAIFTAQFLAWESALDLTEPSRLTPKKDDWCALNFCAGRQSLRNGSLLSQHILERYNQRIDPAEPYLFSLVIGDAKNLECFKYSHPFERFIAACYPRSPLTLSTFIEPLSKGWKAFEAIDPESSIQSVLDNLEDLELLTDKSPGEAEARKIEREANREKGLSASKSLLKSIFVDAFNTGQRIVLNDSQLLKGLRNEQKRPYIEGFASDEVENLTQTLRLNPDRPISPDQLWTPCLNWISSKYPHFNLSSDKESRRIHFVTFVQLAGDIGFRLGLCLSS